MLHRSISFSRPAGVCRGDTRAGRTGSTANLIPSSHYIFEIDHRVNILQSFLCRGNRRAVQGAQRTSFLVHTTFSRLTTARQYLAVVADKHAMRSALAECWEAADSLALSCRGNRRAVQRAQRASFQVYITFSRLTYRILCCRRCRSTRNSASYVAAVADQHAIPRIPRMCGLPSRSAGKPLPTGPPHPMLQSMQIDTQFRIPRMCGLPSRSAGKPMPTT
jgi:hypothetical protein